MKIKLTRHAKNNMRLYKITIEDIQTVIKQAGNVESQKGKTTAIYPIPNKFKECR
jgi:hypothetical protein